MSKYQAVTSRMIATGIPHFSRFSRFLQTTTETATIFLNKLFWKSLSMDKHCWPNASCGERKLWFIWRITLLVAVSDAVCEVTATYIIMSCFDKLVKSCLQLCVQVYIYDFVNGSWQRKCSGNCWLWKHNIWISFVFSENECTWFPAHCRLL